MSVGPGLAAVGSHGTCLRGGGEPVQEEYCGTSALGRIGFPSGWRLDSEISSEAVKGLNERV